ncbi:hypothetical protein NP233_g9316 [Leucocoprinus birnbaumii]|uniref:Uncharacterized protein n=1 Tax=Leucocoprinus birnbaumii TaxID=56174 RepID=A0AAD5VL87_9AGAR|nr:hypothetical protein NP233_g9316 [Leucocoprinus birnbaumii]
MAPLTVSAAQLPALMVESILYGMYLITFVACLQRLLWNKNSFKRFSDINLPMLVVVVFFFISLSLNLSFTLARDIDTFVYSGIATADLDDQDADWVKFLKASLILFQLILADIILIYRCWLVWERSLIISLLPFVCWLGALVCSIYASYLEFVLSPSFGGIQEDRFVALFTAFLSFSIILNVYSTCKYTSYRSGPAFAHSSDVSGAILWRICTVEKGWRPPTICSMRDIPQRSRLRMAKRVIIESGLLYTGTVIALFITIICRSNVVFITSAAEIQLTGIAFNLILARAECPNEEEQLPLPLYRIDRCTLPSRTDESRGTVDVAVMTISNSSGPTS